MKVLETLRSIVVAILIFAIRTYQVVLSQWLGTACRFEPSCSEYFVGALRRHGPLAGVWLGARRISRCHPFHVGGLDPVP